MERIQYAHTNSRHAPLEIAMRAQIAMKKIYSLTASLSAAVMVKKNFWLPRKKAQRAFDIPSVSK